jgi:periplasmic divalent cation tolerance protein
MREIVVFSTTGSFEEAETIARALVSEKLAACCNILPRIRSIYEWEGAIRSDEEAMLIIKSHQEKFPELMNRIRALHSYALPEIISLPMQGGSDEYLAWLRRSLALENL